MMKQIIKNIKSAGNLFKRVDLRLLLMAVGLMVFTANGRSQDPSVQNASPDPLNVANFQQMVLEQNLMLNAARERMYASKLAANTGLAPANPEVEFGYMQGSPDGIGNKVNLRIAQAFDFPTAYIHKRQLRDIQTEQAGIIFDITRQEVLSSARQLYLERIYLNKLSLLLKARLNQAEELVKHYEKMVETGETAKLSLSQVKLQEVALKAEFSSALSGIESNNQSINAVLGGMQVIIADTIFPEYQLPDTTTIFEAYMNGPEMQLRDNDLLKSRAESKLTKSESLPDFSTGYYSEVLTSEAFRGVFLGMSVPLWEDVNRVKRSKAEIVATEAEVISFALEQKSNVSRQIQRYNSMEKQFNELQQALDGVNGIALLRTALNAGEISLAEYIFSSEYYFQNLQKMYEHQRDMLMLKAEIMKIFD